MVSKALPFKELGSIIARFRRAELSFGVIEERRGRYRLWRAPLAGETLRDRRHAVCWGIIEEESPAIEAFERVWKKGKVQLKGKCKINEKRS